MDQITLVEDQIYDGRRFVERFAADGNPVQAAFWAKAAEEDFWFLHVAAEIVERDGPAAAYRAVDASLQKLGECGLSGSEIKAISPNNPIVKDVLALMGRAPIRFRGRRLGPMYVEQAYIYPPHFFTFTKANPMTTEDISREIVRLMNCGPGATHPSRVDLKDGTQFNGVPFTLEVGTQRTLVARFIADGEVAPRVIRLDEIASIR